MNEPNSELLDSSLESPDGVELVNTSPQGSAPQSKPPRRSPVALPWRSLIAICASLLVLVGAIAGFALTHKPATKPTNPTPIVINTQSLDNGTLTKLSEQSGAGKTKQKLTITPDTLFINSVEAQGSIKNSGDLEVGGNLRVGGTSTLQGAVSTNSNLAVRGSLSVGGLLSAGSLNVGSLVVSSITASSNINFGGHLNPGGATPTVRSSVAAGGGSVTISGNDTAGTVTIATANGSLLAGEMAIITFRTSYATTPKVQLTPITSTAASLRYYATRSATFFTIDTATAAASNTNYVFDYLVTQ